MVELNTFAVWYISLNNIGLLPDFINDLIFFNLLFTFKPTTKKSRNEQTEI